MDELTRAVPMFTWTRYTMEMAERVSAADLRAEEIEASYGPPKDGTKAMRTFLNEALSTPTAVAALRRANMLGGNKQGPAAPRGLAMDHLLFQQKKLSDAGSSTRAVKILGTWSLSALAHMRSNACLRQRCCR